MSVPCSVVMKGNERVAVGRVLEERVIGDLHLVVMNAGQARIEADGIGVGDEVHVVAAVRQFPPEFGRHDSAAAVGGVTGDADVHLASVASGVGRSMPAPIWPWMFSSGRGVSPPPNQTRTPAGDCSISASQRTAEFQG